MATKELEIEQLKLGEISKDFFQKKYNCSNEEIENIISQTQRSDKEILNSYPASKMKEAILEKMQRQEGKQKKSTFSFQQKIVTSISAVAAVLVLSLFIPLVSFENKKSLGANLTSQTSSVRVKGSEKQSLHLYKYNNKEVVRLSNHDHIKNGDVVQISYVAGKANNGMIFSIDGNGVLTQHFPESKAVSGVLQQGKEVALDFSYKLDDAPNFERFYFVTGKEPFSSNDLEIVVKSGKVKSVGKNKLTITMFSLEK